MENATVNIIRFAQCNRSWNNPSGKNDFIENHSAQSGIRFVVIRLNRSVLIQIAKEKIVKDDLSPPPVIDS